MFKAPVKGQDVQSSVKTDCPVSYKKKRTSLLQEVGGIRDKPWTHSIQQFQQMLSLELMNVYQAGTCTCCKQHC